MSGGTSAGNSPPWPSRHSPWREQEYTRVPSGSLRWYRIRVGHRGQFSGSGPGSWVSSMAASVRTVCQLVLGAKCGQARVGLVDEGTEASGILQDVVQLPHKGIQTVQFTGALVGASHAAIGSKEYSHRARGQLSGDWCGSTFVLSE